MSEDNTKRNRMSGKKRYIAIAALAGLVATGGVVGATITAESTIANNKIHADVTPAPAPKAVVTATGAPLDLHVTKQDSYNHKHGETRVVPITLENTGNATATVKIHVNMNKVEEGSETGTEVYLYTAFTQKPITLEQVIAGQWPSELANTQWKPGKGQPYYSKSFELAPGDSTVVSMLAQVPKAYMDNPASSGVKLTFDLGFDYVTKGE